LEKRQFAKRTRKRKEAKEKEIEKELLKPYFFLKKKGKIPNR